MVFVRAKGFLRNVLLTLQLLDQRLLTHDHFLLLAYRLLLLADQLVAWVLHRAAILSHTLIPEQIRSPETVPVRM